MPYQGTSVSAASGVAVKRMVVTQLIGACSAGFSATSTSSSIFFASPNSIRLFSLKNSGLSTPA
jgi:hypothetical protein